MPLGKIIFSIASALIITLFSEHYLSLFSAISFLSLCRCGHCKSLAPVSLQSCHQLSCAL